MIIYMIAWKPDRIIAKNQNKKYLYCVSHNIQTICLVKLLLEYADGGFRILSRHSFSWDFIAVVTTV